MTNHLSAIIAKFSLIHDATIVQRFHNLPVEVLTFLLKERAILREADFGEPLVRFREFSIASGPRGEHQQLSQGENHGKSQEHPGQHRRPSCHCPWSASTTRKRNVENGRSVDYRIAIFRRTLDGTSSRNPIIDKRRTTPGVPRVTSKLTGYALGLEVRCAAVFVNKHGCRPIS